MDVDHVLLACTELPLIDLDSTIDAWDVTALLADALVQAASS
jgi:aspartate/glutamate racemase